jgi:hypothetical protein
MSSAHGGLLSAIRTGRVVEVLPMSRMPGVVFSIPSLSLPDVTTLIQSICVNFYFIPKGGCALEAAGTHRSLDCKSAFLVDQPRNYQNSNIYRSRMLFVLCNCIANTSYQTPFLLSLWSVFVLRVASTKVRIISVAMDAVFQNVAEFSVTSLSTRLFHLSLFSVVTICGHKYVGRLKRTRRKKWKESSRNLWCLSKQNVGRVFCNFESP